MHTLAQENISFLVNANILQPSFQEDRELVFMGIQPK